MTKTYFGKKYVHTKNLTFYSKNLSEAQIFLGIPKRCFKIYSKILKTCASSKFSRELQPRLKFYKKVFVLHLVFAN